MSKVVSIRPAREIRVWHDREGWHVQMGATYEVFWKRHLAAGFIDLLLARNVAFVTINGEIPDE